MQLDGGAVVPMVLQRGRRAHQVERDEDNVGGESLAARVKEGGF